MRDKEALVVCERMSPQMLFTKLRVSILNISLVCLALGIVLAQSPRQIPRPEPDEQDNLRSTPQKTITYPRGMVYVIQKIDLRQQLSANEVIYSLDGETIPQLQTTSVTLGIEIDNKGYIVTRLANVSNNNAPLLLTIYASNRRKSQATAKFVGMDSVTGLCVLKVDDPQYLAGAESNNVSAPETLPAQKSVEMYGFNPHQSMGRPGISMLRPRIHISAATLRKAADDFRFSQSNPIYRLTTQKPLTPIQDCSLIAEKDGAVFGMVLYDSSGDDAHLVYPLTRVQQLAAMIIQDRTLAHRSIVPHAWLGATSDGGIPVAPNSKSLTPEEQGVLVAAVFPDSPAEMAGIRPRDVLLSISGRILTTGRDLRETLQMLPADSQVTLRIKRNKEFKMMQARLVPAPALDPAQLSSWVVKKIGDYEKSEQALAPTDPQRPEIERKRNVMVGIAQRLFSSSPPSVRLNVMYGLEVTPLTAQLAKHFSAPGGVLIASINTNGKAGQAGLKVGDIVIKIGELPVVDLATFVQALNEDKNETVEILIVRQGQGMKLKMTK